GGALRAELVLQSLQIVDLGPARPAPLAPGVEDHDLPRVVLLQVERGVGVEYVRAGDLVDRLTIGRRVVVDLELAVGADELECLALRHGVRAGGATGTEDTDHQQGAESGLE